MTVTLGGIALSDHLILTGLDSGPLVTYSITPTLGGNAIIQSDANDPTGGIKLTLVSDNSLTLAQVQAIRGLRGQTVELVHYRGTFNVIVLDTPVTPVINYADPVDDDWFSGEITMITVVI